MEMQKKLFLMFLISLSIGSFLPLRAQVKTDWDHTAKFTTYKTYSWLKVDGGDSLWSQRLQQDVDSQLAAKGWSRVQVDGDATVLAFRKTTSEQSLETLYDGFGGGWRWRGFGGMGMSTTTTETIKVGNVVVDIFDRRSQKLLWRGTDTDDLSGNIDKNVDKLHNDVRKMFRKFPPK
jgi:Domain of unknown function (DUF4136)